MRKLLSSELGLGEEEIPNDVIEALEPLTGYHERGHELAEALHAQRIRCSRIARRFISAARAGKISWLHPLNTQDPSALIGSATKHLNHLETFWAQVQQKLGRLREAEDNLSNLMARLNKQYEVVALQIDTAYPEVMYPPSLPSPMTKDSDDLCLSLCEFSSFGMSIWQDSCLRLVRPLSRIYLTFLHGHAKFSAPSSNTHSN